MKNKISHIKNLFYQNLQAIYYTKGRFSTSTYFTRNQVMKRLEKAKIANGAVNTMQNVWNHAQFKARNRCRKINSEVGALPALLPPASNNNFEANMGHVSSLGQHSEELLQEFGLTDKIKEFRNKKII